MKVYYSYLSDFSGEEIEKLLKYVPKEKQEKLQYVKNQKAKQESILAWYLLHKALVERGIGGYSIVFGENGKPYIKDAPVFFNLSHSNNFVCCCVGDRELGIDCEKIKPVKDNVINKVLTERERKTLKEKDSDFIRFWTLKESFLKHSGSGITSEIYELDFSDSSEDEEFVFNSLCFFVKRVDGYYVSVCGKEKETEFINVRP